jgi:hypothetical protein
MERARNISACLPASVMAFSLCLVRLSHTWGKHWIAMWRRGNQIEIAVFCFNYRHIGEETLMGRKRIDEQE